MTAKRLPNVHPGAILLEEFLKPLDLGQNALARAIDMPPRRATEIVLSKRGKQLDRIPRIAA